MRKRFLGIILTMAAALSITARPPHPRLRRRNPRQTVTRQEEIRRMVSERKRAGQRKPERKMEGQRKTKRKEQGNPLLQTEL